VFATCVLVFAGSGIFFGLSDTRLIQVERFNAAAVCIWYVRPVCNDVTPGCYVATSPARVPQTHNDNGMDDLKPASPPGDSFSRPSVQKSTKRANTEGLSQVAAESSADCRLCRHSCTDRAALQQHLLQVSHRRHHLAPILSTILVSPLNWVMHSN